MSKLTHREAASWQFIDRFFQQGQYCKYCIKIPQTKHPSVFSWCGKLKLNTVQAAAAACWISTFLPSTCLFSCLLHRLGECTVVKIDPAAEIVLLSVPSLHAYITHISEYVETWWVWAKSPVWLRHHYEEEPYRKWSQQSGQMQQG